MKLLTNSAPMLITGSHRSGTTWVGKMLALSHHTYYLGEIFNPEAKLLHERVLKNWFRHIPVAEGEKNEIYPHLLRILQYRFQWPYRTGWRRFVPSRLNLIKYTRRWLHWPKPIMKDPIASLSAEWLAKCFNMQVMCLVRHPAAFVYSVMKAGWGFPYRSLLNQPQLIEEHLYSYLPKLKNPPNSHVERGALLWLCLYKVISTYINRNQEWLVMRIEDISDDPIPEFERIYNYFNLPYTYKIKRQVFQSSSTDNLIESPLSDTSLIRRNSVAAQNVWRYKLSKDQIHRIRGIVEEVSCQYYTERDWL
jgi:hypothetical protein